MSLFPVPNPSYSDLITAQIQTFANDPMFRAAAKSWAYYTLQAYDPRFGTTFNSPYVDWNEDIDGKRPHCQPVGRIAIDSGAEFLFGEAPRLTVPGNTEVEKLIESILEMNDLDAKLLPLGRAAANEGSVWLKFAWTPDSVDRPISISFLSPWEVKAHRDPLDADRILSVRIQIKYQDGGDGKWYLYREVWTAEEYTVYKALETNEHDDTPVLKSFRDGNWPLDYKVPNRFGMIPLVQVYNRRVGSETDGVGDLWDVYSLIDDISHTYWLMNRSNQWDGDPITALINVDNAPTQIYPGSLVSLKGGPDADIKRLIPENNLRQWMQAYAGDMERMVFDAVGADRLNPEEITNQGNLTRAVLELIFHRSVKSALEKRKNWGRPGLARFLQRLLLAMAKLSDARARMPALKTISPDKPDSYKVVVSWPSMFKITADERTMILKDLAASIASDLLSWERAVEIAAEVWGITDVATLKAELEKQKADKKADAKEQLLLTNPPPSTPNNPAND